MKTLKLFIFAAALVLAGTLHAQVSVNINIGSPPPWGPVGYSEVQYYYLPDVEAYYDVPSSMFIYLSNGVWIRRTYLPRQYRNYDLYHGYKVVLTDYHGNDPYRHYKSHKSKYAKGYRGHEQHNIGQRPDNHNSRYKSQPDKKSYKESNRDNNKHDSRDNDDNKRNNHGKSNKGKRK
ncbi:MAG: hypothetical protein HOO86_14700 [Bacteroidales bacterium]|nr:hypothetical protein [Bacteroidales bacterium]